jgi:hypothetical protein
VIHTTDSSFPPILVPSFRGLETRCIKLVGRILISGGEDGTLRVHDGMGAGFTLVSCRREQSVVLGCTLLGSMLFTCGAMDSVCAWTGNVRDGFKKVWFRG